MPVEDDRPRDGVEIVLCNAVDSRRGWPVACSWIARMPIDDVIRIEDDALADITGGLLWGLFGRAAKERAMQLAAREYGALRLLPQAERTADHASLVEAAFARYSKLEDQLRRPIMSRAEALWNHVRK